MRPPWITLDAATQQPFMGCQTHEAIHSTPLTMASDMSVGTNAMSMSNQAEFKVVIPGKYPEEEPLLVNSKQAKRMILQRQKRH